MANLANKRTAILASGGDSPGMSAAIIGVTRALKSYGIEVSFVTDGYVGLVNNLIEKAENFSYEKWINLGGSFLGSARLPSFKDPKVRQIAIDNLKKKKITSLVVIGGDGSYRGAEKLTNEGIQCVCLPGTIDNDVVSTEYTIGFDTAINTAQDSIRKVKDTMNSHRMCGVVEVMGRHCSDIAVYAGIASGADVISIHERKLTIKEITDKLLELKNKGERGFTVVISEFLYDIKELVSQIEEITKIGTRPVVLGHTQRGGLPNAMDSYRAQIMAWKAAECISNGIAGVCIGWNKNETEVIKINEALKRERTSYKTLIDFYNATK